MGRETNLSLYYSEVPQSRIWKNNLKKVRNRPSAWGGGQTDFLVRGSGSE